MKHELTEENQVEFNRQMSKALQALRKDEDMLITITTQAKKAMSALRMAKKVLPTYESDDSQSLLNTAMYSVKKMRGYHHDLPYSEQEIEKLLNIAVIHVKALREVYDGVPF